MADEKVVFHPNPLAQLDEVLGGSVTDFVVDTNTYSPANRPQDIRYEFPERGAESHGVNDDTPTSEYFPDQVNGDPRIVTDTGHSTSMAMELVPVDPVAVYEVPHPQRSIRKFATMRTLFNGTTMSWTGGLYVPDPSTVISLSADETRVKVTVLLVRNPAPVVAPTALAAGFAMSYQSDFNGDEYIPLIAVMTASSAFVAQTVLTLDNCKDGLYFAIVPMAAYDSTKPNTVSLAVIQEYAVPIDHNPAEA